MKNKFYLLSFLVILSFSSCTVLTILFNGVVPKQMDYKKFPQSIIHISEQPFTFIKPNHNYQLGEKIKVTTRDLNSTSVCLNDFMDYHKTISFLIIRNDTILFESYNRNFYDTSLVGGFSLSKPIISTLIGIAIDEGKITSQNDPITKYISELRGKEGFEKITIKHLLQHTSGIQWSGKLYSIFSDNAKYYWTKNLRSKIKNCRIEAPPGTKFEYSSINTLLCTAILENATRGSTSKYLEEKIWMPLGMESPAIWSFDNNHDTKIEKTFCCLQARTSDYAKIGRLYLKNGNWEGKQIISKDWIINSTQSDTFANNKVFYNNNWGLGPLKYGSYFAVGLYGQYIYIYPKENIIMVRFGESELFYSSSYWQNVFIQIIDQMESKP